MPTTISKPEDQTTGQQKDNLNYLWLNGERIIGIQGLEIFQDCRQLQQMPVISDEQRMQLNDIINEGLQKSCEEGVCDYWPGLVASAKNYLSEQGYCVTSQGRLKIEIRQQVEVSWPVTIVNERHFTDADLWDIYRRRKIRSLRRYL